MPYLIRSFSVTLLVIIMLIPLGASLSHGQTWSQWKHFFDESGDSYVGPPESRLILEQYVHEVEARLDPMIERYLATLKPEYHEDFLQGQLLVQVKSSGRTAIVDLLGNYNKKRRYSVFIRSIKRHRFSRFPQKMDVGLIQLSHTLDKSRRRQRTHMRYDQGHWYFFN